MRWLCLIVPIVAAVGCSSKADLKALEVALEECRTDKSLAQETAVSCQARYDREVSRWQDTDALLAEVLPRVMEDFQTERQRIIASNAAVRTSV